jgi:transposase
LVEKLKTWLETRLVAVSEKSTIVDAIRCGLSRWNSRFLDDGRIEMDTNSVERAMRPIASNRKNSLFAGHDECAVNWACLASLIETAKIHGIDPQIWPISSPSSSTTGLCKNSTSYRPGPGPNSRLPIP